MQSVKEKKDLLASVRDGKLQRTMTHLGRKLQRDDSGVFFPFRIKTYNDGYSFEPA